MRYTRSSAVRPRRAAPTSGRSPAATRKTSRRSPPSSRLQAVSPRSWPRGSSRSTASAPRRFLDEAGDDHSLRVPLSPSPAVETGLLGAEVLYAFRRELAQTLSDVLLRRT